MLCQHCDGTQSVRSLIPLEKELQPLWWMVGMEDKDLTKN